MRRMLITAAAGLALTLTATAPSLAADQLVDTCREVPETDAAKLKNRPAVLADIDGTLSQYVLLDYGPTNAAFLDMGVASGSRRTDFRRNGWATTAPTSFSRWSRA
jgi:hypothetical protein